jgi:hypothetical protein
MSEGVVGLNDLAWRYARITTCGEINTRPNSLRKGAFVPLGYLGGGGSTLLFE